MSLFNNTITLSVNSDYKFSVCIYLKEDLHSANVSPATDTICWRMVFFNIHLRRTEFPVYLTNLFFLPEAATEMRSAKQLSGLWIKYVTYYLARSSSFSKITGWKI